MKSQGRCRFHTGGTGDLGGRVIWRNSGRFRDREGDCLLYTSSGSTGRPKGVITSMLSLMNYIDAYIEVMGITEADVLGNQSPLDYIAAIRDIYIPLFTGASTVSYTHLDAGITDYSSWAYDYVLTRRPLFIYARGPGRTDRGRWRR